MKNTSKNYDDFVNSQVHKDLTEKVKNISKKFIDDIKSEKIQKETLPNISEDFDVERETKNFYDFVNSKAYKDFIKESRNQGIKESKNQRIKECMYHINTYKRNLEKIN